MLMYANTTVMNPMRFLCVQKYARLPVSDIMIKREKRTSVLEISPLSLLLELLCTGLGSSCYTAKLPAPAKSWWLLQLPGKCLGKEALQLGGGRGWHCPLHRAAVGSEVHLVKTNRVTETCGAWSPALYFQELIFASATGS